MTREEAKTLLPIIKAFCEGKQIQFLFDDWKDITEIGIREFLENPELYRIKPEIKFRPFKDAEECWQEMMKHQPFGWVNYNGYRINIATVMCTAVIFTNNKGLNFTFAQVFEECTFVDGQPFGIKMNE